MTASPDWFIRPLGRHTFSGTLPVPGDKSISHRALMLLALAGGRNTIKGLLQAADVMATQEVLMKTVLRRNRPPADLPHCDCGNSGTTIRLMMGILAGRKGSCILDGDDSLRRRPMERVAKPLGLMGADIRTTLGKPPVAIKGRPLVGSDIEIPVASAQVKSALLLAGLHAEGETVIRMPMASRDHTERMLDYLGCPVEAQEHGEVVRIQGGSPLTGRDIDVPGDISSAAFLVVAALLAENAAVTLDNVGVNPTRTGMLTVLERAGIVLERMNERELCREPRADLVIRPARPARLDIEPADVPSLIDEIPVLALLAAHADCERSVIRGAGELKVKESDRIATVARELHALGLKIEPTQDGFVIPGRQRVNGGVVESRGDHRIAMTGAIAGLVSKSGVTVRNTACVATSFPDFPGTLRRLGAVIEEVEPA